MSKRYTQLTEAERYHIYTMKKQGYTDTAIANGMGRDRTTIWRELHRNTGQRGYRHQQAQQLTIARHQAKPKQVKLTPEVQAVLRAGLAQRWSPEQIAGRRCRETGQRLSAETIYQYSARDKRSGGTLYRQLRYQGKSYRKKYGRTDYRGRIPGRVDIDQRPAIVAARTRLGDWEADLVMGKAHQGAIVTLAERCCKLYLASPIVRKTAALTSQAITDLLSDFKAVVHTITYDNGREFNGHQAINQALGCDSYFAKPYHSWERGLNENFNGLLRQYFPKGMAFDQLSQDEVCAAVNEMNHRPRKSLGFKTPWEVFSELVQKNTKTKPLVALMT